MLTYSLPRENIDEKDPMFDKAVELIQETGKASASLIQRRLDLGYARSARLLDQMEQYGIIGPANGAKPREILIPHNNNEGQLITSTQKPEPFKDGFENNLAKWKKTKYTYNKSGNFEIELGVDNKNKKISINLDKYENLFVIGSQFTNTIDLLNTILAGALARYSPDDLRVVVIDGTRGDLIVPNQASHLLTPVIVEPEKTISSLKWGVYEIEKRLKTFSEVGCLNIKEWNIKAGFQGMPNILYIINSLEQFLNFSPLEIEDNLCRLFSLGRKAGVFFVIGVDPASLKSSKKILSNNATKLVFKLTDKNMAKSFGTPESVELNSPEEAILSIIFEENKKIKIEKSEPKKIYEEIFEK